MIKAATAATESPAICAGVILGRSLFEAGAAPEVGVEDEDRLDVADAGAEIESANTDWLEETCVWSVDLMMDVIVAREIEVVEEVETRDVVLGVRLGTTVSAVLVGSTAFL